MILTFNERMIAGGSQGCELPRLTSDAVHAEMTRLNDVVGSDIEVTAESLVMMAVYSLTLAGLIARINHDSEAP